MLFIFFFHVNLFGLVHVTYLVSTVSFLVSRIWIISVDLFFIFKKLFRRDRL